MVLVARLGASLWIEHQCLWDRADSWSKSKGSGAESKRSVLLCLCQQTDKGNCLSMMLCTFVVLPIFHLILYGPFHRLGSLNLLRHKMVGGLVCWPIRMCAKLWVVIGFLRWTATRFSAFSLGGGLHGWCIMFLLLWSWLCLCVCWFGYKSC